MNEVNAVVAESFVRALVEDTLVRKNLIPMPVSGQSSHAAPQTGKLVDVPLRALTKDREVYSHTTFVADNVVATVAAQQNDPPATESYVRQVLLFRLAELSRKFSDRETEVLYARARNLVATDELATVEFVTQALTAVFSPPSAEQELLALASPYMRPGERLMEFFARTNVSASELRTLPRAEIAQRILRREREIEDEQKEAAERKARSQPQPPADPRDAYLARMRQVVAQG
jgi:hypothetical protein